MVFQIFGIIDNGFGPQGPIFFEVLLNERFLILDRQVGIDPGFNDPGAKPAGGTFDDGSLVYVAQQMTASAESLSVYLARPENWREQFDPVMQHLGFRRPTVADQVALIE